MFSISAFLTTIHEKEFITAPKNYIDKPSEKLLHMILTTSQFKVSPQQETIQSNFLVNSWSKMWKMLIAKKHFRRLMMNSTISKARRRCGKKSPNNWDSILAKTSYGLNTNTFTSLYHFTLTRLVE